MALLSLEDVHLSYGEQHLLRGVSMLIGDRERIGVLGPNGSGKSSLMRILAGIETPDDGRRIQRRGLTVGYLEQEPEMEPDLRVRDVAREGLAGRDEVLRELDRVHEAMADPELTPAQLERLMVEQGRLDDQLEALGGHDVEHRVESLIHAVGLPDPEARCGDLSGGERRRAALARLLISDPDLLLLDEPTNHLDAEVIAWLEGYLLQSRASLVLITHDRYFLDRVVDRIVEIERGALHEYEGSYADFLEARAARLEREQKEESTRCNLLRRETEWMRRGPPARTGKSKARIQRFHALEGAAPEADAGELSFRIPCETRLGDRVIAMHGVDKSYGDLAVLRGMDFELGAGQRLGIVGPNGAGKSTVLRLSMGQIEPDAGTVSRGSTVRFSYIDQSRSDLDPDKTVIDEVGGGNDHVFVDGRKQRIEGYLERFLFPSKMMRTRVGDLSGGERNRVLLAKLLSVGGNVLVLDEPTNDLDLMTLRVLEEAICAFPGAALIVSHDRWFLDRVATRVLHVGIDGSHRMHEGAASDLIEKLLADAASKSTEESGSTKAKKDRTAKPEPAAEPPHKLSFKEKQELDELPDRIAGLESDIEELDGRLADPQLYSGDPEPLRRLVADRERKAASLAEAYQRWEELESRAG